MILHVDDITQLAFQKYVGLLKMTVTIIGGGEVVFLAFSGIYSEIPGSPT